MLPSLGCFSSLECPFYNGGAGQCSRPYCHYRHVKRDPNAPPEQAEDILGPVPNIEPSQSEAGTSSDGVLKNRSSSYRAIVDAAPEYNPTPISQLRSSHIPIPYTPTIPTRTSAVKRSKPSSEYVPHHVGTTRPSYPPYCPSSISSLNSQVQSSALSDPLKNPLFEIYGPEGAQYSPNDVEPVNTAYSYAPESVSYAPYSPEYVPSKVSYNPGLSPQDSQLSDDDDDVDLAVETAAQTNGDPGGGESLIDLDLSELDNLEFEFEDDSDNGNEPVNTNSDDVLESSNQSENTKDSSLETERHIKSSPEGKSRSLQKGDKRRSSSASSNSEVKKHKAMHSSEKSKDVADKNKAHEDSSSKNGQKDKKASSSSSNSKKSSSSSSTSNNHSKSQAKKEPSSSKSSKSSSSSETKKSHSSDSKSKTSSSSSKQKDKHRDKDKPREKEKDRHHSKDKDHSKEKDKSKDKDRGKDKIDSKSKHSKKSSRRSVEEKEKKELQREKLEEEIRKIEVELDASLEDEDMIEQQCFEMFSEYSETLQNQPLTDKTEDQRVTVNEEPVSSSSSKKRIAHQASHSSLQPNPKPTPTVAKKCSPYQVMRDRWEMLKKEKLEFLSKKPTLAVAPSTVPRPSAPVPYSSTQTPQASLPNAGKKKIAGVPNVAMLLKPPAAPNTSTSTSSSSGTSPSRFYSPSTQRVDEYGRLVKVRVAHTPNMDAPAMRKPIVNPSDCRKFKVATRQSNVNKLFQAYIDAGFGEASHDMALESEKTSTQGTESLMVYSHRIIQTLKDLRACAETSQNGPKMDGMSGIPNRVVSHNAMLAGKLGAKVSWSIQTAKKEPETKSRLSLYEQLKPYILSKELLEENGFPIPSGEKGVASIKPSAYKVITQPTDPRQKICVRCLKPYAVNKRGEQVKDEECFYHWGRKLTTRRYREAETKYTCCDGIGSGCSVSPYHVFEQVWDKNSGYMSTLSKPWMEADPGVYALDCEMCYTTAGIELTRVTVIKEDLSVAYETLVKPSNKILDYNTRFSGITEEDMKGVSTNILQVQATLLGMFCDKSILIGHSLESDMKALKLIHPTVVDTSVVFPHKMGPPKKRALRNLAAENLRKIIQNDVGGHDSKEDAVAALELMLWKLKEDEKTK